MSFDVRLLIVSADSLPNLSVKTCTAATYFSPKDGKWPTSTRHCSTVEYQTRIKHILSSRADG